MKDSGFGVRAAGFLLVWVMILLSAATAIYAMAGDRNLLAREMLRFAPPKSTGLPEAQYEGMGRMIADYLTGKEAVFQYSFADAEGNTYRCFQQHEADHMADCRALILEGSYCNIPLLRDTADVRFFLATAPEIREARLIARESPESLAMFRKRWIPLEDAYFAAFGLPDAGCIVLEEAGSLKPEDLSAMMD